ncbi:hypothetical protein C8Q75DRAFT_811814 [Abortiporus biennis]|nr:hypothetical protein C8Q75DRAFT_811814 [Abortiporus biennis]
MCSTVSSTALELLWETLDSIAPLVRLSIVLRRTECINAPFFIHTTFLHYTNYVHSITVESGTIPSEFLTKSEIPLLPNLRHLLWTIPSATLIQPLSLLFSPTLTSMRVEVTADSSSSDQVVIVSSLADGLKKVGIWCADMTSLELIWFNTGPIALSSAILYCLTSFNSLISITASIDAIASLDTVVILSRLPRLHKMDLIHHGETNYCRIVFSKAQIGFYALRELRLDAPYPLVRNILGAMPVSTLRSCCISLQGTYSDPMQKLIVDSTLRTASSSLENLTLQFPGDQDISIAGTYKSLSFSIFPVIRTFSLVKVDVGRIDAERVTDAFYRDLAMSWPRLHTLHLQSVGVIRNPPPSMVSLRGFRYLAEGCKDLSDVLIQVNAGGNSWIDEDQSRTWAGLQNSVTLNLSVSLVTAPIAVAAYLQRCFPRLSSIWFNEVEARMCGLRERISMWNELYVLLFSDPNR